MRNSVFRVMVIAAALLVTPPLTAGDRSVDLEVVLAIDMSSTADARDFKL
jgi:hypothetical protein